MKKILILCFLLTGCNVHYEEMRIAIKRCENNDGLSRMYIYGFARELHCVDGATFKRGEWADGPIN